jgi:hypothetical protein
MTEEEAPEWARELITEVRRLAAHVEDLEYIEIHRDDVIVPHSAPDIPDDEPLPPPPPRTGPPPCTHQHQKLVKGVVTCAMCDKPLVQSGVVESSLTNQRPFDPRTVTQGTTDYKAD